MFTLSAEMRRSDQIRVALPDAAMDPYAIQSSREKSTRTNFRCHSQIDVSSDNVHSMT